MYIYIYIHHIFLHEIATLWSMVDSWPWWFLHPWWAYPHPQPQKSFPPRGKCGEGVDVTCTKEPSFEMVVSRWISIGTERKTHGRNRELILSWCLIWLVVWNMTFFLPIILGMSSSQLTNSIIFQRGGEKPPTSGPGKLARNFFSPLCQVPGWYGEMTKGWGRWLDGADDGLDDNDDRWMNDYDWICKLYYIIIIINLS